ncbi:hypothetical protein B0H13DRAFT_2312408 [Mycena leptocephala]|nr:hypothetical protein B0H13DRAFT_2312408 [Mycena leptocephala]
MPNVPVQCSWTVREDETLDLGSGLSHSFLLPQPISAACVFWPLTVLAAIWLSQPRQVGCIRGSPDRTIAQGGEDVTVDGWQFDEIWAFMGRLAHRLPGAQAPFPSTARFRLCIFSE